MNAMNLLGAMVLTAVVMTGGRALAADAEWRYLDNGQVRLGVNMDAGGSIGWFSASGAKTNVLNAFDHGRYVQQSYYGDEDGSDWNGKPWRYNPVQGGSWKGVPAEVLDEKLDKDSHSLYVKTKPRQWASGKDVDDMIMEEWIRLEGGLVRLKFRMTYSGEETHQPRHQEMPAVFVMPKYGTLVLRDDKTGEVMRRQPGFPNELVKVRDPWAAWVDDQNQGVGIWFPHADFITTYRVTNAGKGNVSYLAPLQTFSLKPGLVVEYEAVLALGSLEELRAVFDQLEKAAGKGAER